ncbi:MAG TPA: iron uptake porin [Stenomitos sp.]
MSFKFKIVWMLHPVAALCVLAGVPWVAQANEIDNGASNTLPGTLSPLITDLSSQPSVTKGQIVAPSAHPPIVQDVNEASDTAAQVTSVSQLTDVQPTDWAFQALQSLVERYGCIAGYPDGTFRGNRAATRYELAAALNTCLDQISDRFTTKEDLKTVQALQEEFRSELTSLKGRIDGLDARIANLQAQTFATTTKLSGEVVMIASEVFSDNATRARTQANSATPDFTSNAYFANRARLNFDTSFNGRDRLRVRLQARSIPGTNGVSGTNMTRTGADGTNNNTFELDDLWYQFRVGSKGRLTLIAKSGEFNDFVTTTFNPYLASSGTGALSRFGRFSPIYRFGDTNNNAAGAVFNYQFNPKWGVSVGYLADNPGSVLPAGSAQGNLSPAGGLFGGSYAALAQVEFNVTPTLALGLTYAHAFQEGGFANATGSTGSAFATRPFLGANVAQSVDSAGLQFTWKVSPKFNISGWGNITFVESAAPIFGRDRQATVLNWALVLAAPDLFKDGNLGALVIGQQPRVVASNLSNYSCSPDLDQSNNSFECDPNWHIEALYRIRVNGNITVTPGVIVNLNAENNATNAAFFQPIIRTTFVF